MELYFFCLECNEMSSNECCGSASIDGHSLQAGQRCKCFTEKPGVLQSGGLQWVRHRATELTDRDSGKSWFKNQSIGSKMRLRGFLELRRPWGFSPEARRGSQGASRAAPGMESQRVGHD